MKVDWPTFMARHDLVWDEPPTRWDEGAFLGNGLLGLMIYQPAEPHGGHLFDWTWRPEEKNSLRFDVGRSDVTDHRPGKRTLVDEARLPIGHFLLTPVGKITGCRMRLDLWNAEAGGELTTEAGTITWRALIASNRNVMVVEVEASEGERDYQWQWVPAISESTRLYKWDTGGHGRDRPQDKYPANPPAVTKQVGTCQVSAQPMLAGGDYATAWKTRSTAAGKRQIYISVGYTRGKESSAAKAVEQVDAAAAAPLAELLAAHRNWWQAYYRQSFVSLPDARLESFYWIQMYKLAAATRADRPAMDLMGPWFKTTIWPGMWWNLNTQLAYSPVYTANRLQIGESLCRLLDENVENLVANAEARFGDHHLERFGEAALLARATGGGHLAGGMFKGQREAPEIGNLTWALHNYWRQCRYAGDDKRLQSRLLPLLRRSVNLYLALLEQDDDGVYHLPPTYSPERGYGPNCNYDLALLAWGCRTLITECERLEVDDPLLPKWKDVAEHLAPFPVDDNGFMLARGVPFEGGHRHYSHLLMIYPLHLVPWDQPENRDLLRRSIDHWAGERKAFVGYSYAGAASMYALMGEGERAAVYLDELIDRQVTPNTMYLEAESPVIESPLSAAQSIHDILLTSSGGKVRVFPAVPKTWEDVSFSDLAAEGGFRVSAVRRGGQTEWISVHSRAGEPCRIVTDIARPIKVSGNIPFTDAAGVVTLQLAKNQQAVLTSAEQEPALSIQPVAADGPTNFFGLNGRHVSEEK